MPSATPLPGTPSHLVLFGAEDLLTRGGCPVCHYVAGVDGRFVAWFALEGHADPVMITRLCASLGLCPRHTRGLLAQPGADARLTPVYCYLLHAARECLTAGKQPRLGCPACARDADGASRALSTLLTGLADPRIRDRYRRLGGLCMPHLRDAVRHAGRRDAAWLAETALSRLAAGPSFAELAGDTDPDAGIRAQLRARLAVSGSHAPAASSAAGERASRRDGACVVCRAAAEAERDWLDGIIRLPAYAVRWEIRARDVCAAHLQDAWAHAGGARADAAAASRDLSPGLLAAVCEDAASWLAAAASAAGGMAITHRLARRRRNRRASGDAPCPVCRAARAAAGQQLSALRAAPGHGTAPRPAAPGLNRPGICVRHVLSLRELDARAGDLAARDIIRRADQLMAGLGEAFRKRTWEHRHEARGEEMSTWQHAVALIDGRVYGGGSPAPLQHF